MKKISSYFLYLMIFIALIITGCDTSTSGSSDSGSSADESAAVIASYNGTLSGDSGSSGNYVLNITEQSASKGVVNGTAYLATLTLTVNDSTVNAQGTALASIDSSDLISWDINFTLNILNCSFDFNLTTNSSGDVTVTMESDDAGAETINASSLDVYITGYENLYAEDYDGNEIAKYWKNGVEVILSSESSCNEGNSITVVDDVVYVAGTMLLGTNIAKYWKDGSATNLTDGTHRAKGSSIYVDGSDIYVSGYECTGDENSDEDPEDNYYAVAKYWKNGTEVELSDGTSDAEGCAIYVSGSDIYVAGSNNSKACYWKNGTEVDLTDGTTDAECTAIYVNGTDIYAVGTEDYVVKYWINGSETSLTSSSTLAVASSMAVTDSGDLYISGTKAANDSLTKTVVEYWKNGSVSELTSGDSYGESNGISVVDENVYVCGLEATGDAYTDSENNPAQCSVAKYWVNGTEIELTDGTSNASAHAITVVSN